ncbi:MAG: hypothetical protein SH809_02110 [Rhodothermales bacterium]|nr:hypothetical protein [Rhodothermales bacterium]
MTAIEQLTNRLDKLSEAEREAVAAALLRVWDAKEWDEQIEADIAAGKLDFLIEEVEAEIVAGRIKLL